MTDAKTRCTDMVHASLEVVADFYKAGALSWIYRNRRDLWDELLQLNWLAVEFSAAGDVEGTDLATVALIGRWRQAMAAFEEA